MFVCLCASLFNRTPLLRLLRTRPAEGGMAAAVPNSEEAGPIGICAGVSGTTSGLSGEGDSEEAEEFTSSSHCSELSRRQNEQRKQGLFCDVTLAFSGGATRGDVRSTFELMAHRSVLSAASDYFSTQLGGQYSESVSGRVDVKEWRAEPGPDRETAENVIQFMYTGEIRVSSANVPEVLELADRFLLKQLKEFCGEFLLRRLRVCNCVWVHSLAHAYSLQRLMQRAAALVRSHFQQVALEEAFAALPLPLVRGWLADEEVAVATEEALLAALLRWVRGDEGGRRHHFPELFWLLRLALMRPSVLYRLVREEPLVSQSAPCLQRVAQALEDQALGGEGAWPRELPAYQPRAGQLMDVVVVVGGVSEGGDYLSECVGYFLAEERWVQLPHIHTHLDGHALATTDTHLYAAGSMDPGFAKSVQRYCPARNTWEQVSSLPVRKHSFGLVCVGECLYSIGGHGNLSAGSKDVSVYGVREGRWWSAEAAPRPLRDVKVLSVAERYVYVTGRTPGGDGDEALHTVTPTTLRYDTLLHSWSELPQLPLLDNYCTFQTAVSTTPFYHTSSFTPQRYAQLGHQGEPHYTRPTEQQEKKKEEEEEEEEGGCSRTGGAPLEARETGGSGVKEGEGCGGALLDTLPPEVLGVEGAAVCCYGDDVFVLGGWRGGEGGVGSCRREAYRYCARRKRWTLLPPLPHPRTRAAACHLRIPYRFLIGQQTFPPPHNLTRQRDRMHQMQQLHRRTLSLRRQLHSQIEC